MKKLLLSLLLFATQMAYSQDVIITKDGDALKVYGLEVSSNAVFFRESADENSAIKRMQKADLLMIKYQDGRKEIIGEEPKPVQQKVEEASEGTQPVKPTFDNTSAIAFYNNTQVGWQKAPKAKKAEMSYMRLKVKDGSILESEDVLLVLTVGSQYKDRGMMEDGQIEISVKNKTAKTIYLDLGNTFFVRMGEPVPFYVPGASSSYSSSSSGGSVNLGSVAGALSVGGAVGTLAGGVNVGGSSTNGTATITYTQRVVAVPPMSIKSIGKIQLLDTNAKWDTWPIHINSRITGGMARDMKYFSSICDWRRGDIIHWESGNSPFNFSFYMQYSYEESCAKPISMNFDLYTSEAYAIENRTFWADMKYFSTNWNNAEVLHFFLENESEQQKSVFGSIVSAGTTSSCQPKEELKGIVTSEAR